MQKLTDEMQAIGLIPDNVVLDGEIHRLSTGNSKKNGWYVGRQINNKVFCTFGRWDTGQKIWFNSHKTLTSADNEILRLISERVKQDKRKKQAAAARLAVKIMSRSIIAEHPYLDQKNIELHVARIDGNELVVPIFRGAVLVNVQRIFPDGKKLFLAGGEVKGCACSIPGDGKICICEGFATGASIQQATGYRVIVAFNAGNLPTVAEAVRVSNPDAHIIICADNDESGTGQKYGRIAADKARAGFRMPPRVGCDFNDLEKEEIKAAINMPEGVLSVNEISVQGDKTLIIPDRILNVAGLISDGLEGCSNSSEMPDIPQYSFPVILSILARTLAGRLSFAGQWPSLYNIKVGGTSTGKTDVDRVLKRELKNAGVGGFYGPTDFSSGPGLLRGMAEEDQAQTIIHLDEVTSLFRRYSKQGKDPVANGKISALLELYTNCGGEIKKPYGDKNKNIIINNPCLILVGNATPIIFDDFEAEDLTSGLLQRFDFWTYYGKIPYRQPYTGHQNKALERFVESIQKLMSVQFYRPKSGRDLKGVIGCDVPLDCTDGCRKLMEEHSRDVIDRSNALAEDSDSGSAGIISRQYNLAHKYAMIHIVSTRPIGKITDPVTVDDYRWGMEVAAMLSEWKTQVLIDRVTGGDFHKHCEMFKAAIAAAMKQGWTPTGKALAARRRAIKALRPREFDEVVKALRARGEIYVDEDGGHTKYFLLNNNSNN